MTTTTRPPTGERTATRKRTLRRRLSALPTHLILIIAAALTGYPLFVMASTAFKSNAEVYQNPVGFPQQPTIDNFVLSWHAANFPNLFLNSTIFTVTSMVLAILVSSLAAYGLVRVTSRISSFAYLGLSAGIFLPLQLAIIPQFQLMVHLGLVDSYLGVILIYAAGSTPFGVFLIASFMQAIPREFGEAAAIDGAGFFQTYWRIYLPMARPAIGSFIVLQGVGIWNDYLVPLLLLSDPTKRTLTTGILLFKQQYVADWGNIMAGVLIMTIPIIIVFVFAQRYFVSGLFSGGVK